MPADFSTAPDPQAPNPEPQEDGRAHAGDIEHIFRQHNDALLRFIATRLGSRQEAAENGWMPPIIDSNSSKWRRSPN